MSDPHAHPPNGAPLDLVRALSRVAVRAALVRDVRLADWRFLIEALDELELTEPGTAAELSAEVDRVIAGWRDEMGVGGHS